MNIRNTRELRSFAAERLGNAQNIPRIVLIYAAVTLGLSALVTTVNYVLGLQLDTLGGLSNLGKRNTLSTIQNVLPIAMSLVTMCIEVGYLAAMLRTARGQYTSPQTLRLGFDRFWLLLRCTIAKSLIYLSLAFSSIYLGIMLFMLSPLSRDAMAILTPYMEEMSVLSSTLVMEDAVYAQFALAVTPAYILCGVILLVVLVPVMYSYRMVNYIIIDHPAIGAMAALRESKKMMKGNRLHLFKLDLRLWWYHLASTAASVLCYGDILLPMLGIELPWHEDVSYFLFFALYLTVMFAIYVFLRSRVEVTYALAYDALKPEEKQDSGVVLGNIFQM